MFAASKSKKRGFTLLEMLAVVTILGIIAAVVVPRFTNFTDTSKTNISQHHISQLNALVERHYSDASAWPADLAELVSDGYIEAVPTHPDTTKTYSLNSTTHRVEEVPAN
jgi:prepilin-type N-terminal cleavage/methylation domain-containing protein